MLMHVVHIGIVVLYRRILKHLKWNLKNYSCNHNRLGRQIILTVITVLLNTKQVRTVSHRERFIVLFPVDVKLHPQLLLVYTVRFCATTLSALFL
jgi:hypothetical protein